MAGLGLAYLNLWGAQPDIKKNRLVRVLDEWTPSFEGLCLYYPGRRHLPAPLRALVDLVKEMRSGKLREQSPNHALMTGRLLDCQRGKTVLS